MDRKDTDKYVRPNILALTPYSTARDDYQGGDISAWLDANENPYDNGVNRYPDPHQCELKAHIAKLKGVMPDNLFIGGAGSDEAIDLIYRIFCEPGIDNVVAISPSYGVYSVAAAINDIEYREVQLGDDFSLPVDDLLYAADSHTKAIWICSPNNPTGNAFDTDLIISIVERFDGIVVVDEAYVDFSDKGSVKDFIQLHPNLIVMQTLSKAWGMASLRIGIAISCPEIARLMAMVKYPYNVNGPTQREAIRRTMTDISPMVNEIKRQKAMLEEQLATIPVVKRVYPSDANFLLVQVDDADDLYRYLIECGIIVRNRSRVPGCEGCLRITIGTPQDNTHLLQCLRAYRLGDKAPVTAAIKPTANNRRCVIDRNTAETRIHVDIDLDGNSAGSHIDTGLKFLDHMLYQLPHHGGLKLDIKCDGDLQVDEHHTMEDTAIALGEAINNALGDKRGINRYGFVLPMDESRAMVLLDFGGRAELVWDVPFEREYVGDTPTEMYPHLFKALASAMRANIYIQARGENNHHKIEAVFKAFARALRDAINRKPFEYDMPSSKGIL